MYSLVPAAVVGGGYAASVKITPVALRFEGGGFAPALDGGDRVIVRGATTSGAVVAPFEQCVGVFVDADAPRSVVQVAWHLAFSLSAPVVGVFGGSAAKYAHWSLARKAAAAAAFSLAVAVDAEAASTLGVEHHPKLNAVFLLGCAGLRRRIPKGLFS